MEECEWKSIFTNYNIPIRENEKNTWKPLLRQCMVCTGIWYMYLMQGLYLGAPTVLIAQIRREANSTEAVTDEMSSWLSATPIISALPLLFILPWLFHRIGRKFTHLTACSICIISYILFYTSTNFREIVISQIFFGASFAASSTFEPIMIAEYASPKYRGIFLTLKSVMPFWGIWIANIIGTYFYWKNIIIISFVCSVYIATVFIWPESPYWLAMKGRYLECARSHRWLRGIDEKSEKELAQLIVSEKRPEKKTPLSEAIERNRGFSQLSKIWLTITSRTFYKPVLVSMILFAQYQFTGKLVMGIYAIDVLKNLTHDESVAYKGMLILDGITVFSMYVGCILSRYFKRRTLLFSFASIGNLLLYVLSLYLYLVSLSLVAENHFVIIFLLSVFSIATGCGPVILPSSIYGEIIPTRYQSSSMIIVSLSNTLVMSTLFKISPLMFKVLKMHGSLLFFAAISTFIIVILYIYLPETKDKTIKEIEEQFTKDHLSVQQKLLKEVNK